MPEWTLTKTRLQAGMWEGVIAGSTDQPAVSVTHLDQPVDAVQLTQLKDSEDWRVQIAIPAEAVSDGVQTLLIMDKTSQEVVEKITLIAGDALGDDLRAEVDLLRAELDMLKRAFRRHCVETA